MASVPVTKGVMAATSGLALVAVTAQYPFSLADGERGVVFETIEYLSYFTILSNLLVAVGTLLLALDPSRREPWVAAVRLSGLMMITVTGIVYHLVLAADNPTTGIRTLTDHLLHTAVPVVTLVGWLLVGPRGLFTWRTLGYSLIIPLAWLGYALVRDAVVGNPTYPFMDIPGLGFAAVAINLLVIVLVALGLGAAKVGADRWLHRRTLPVADPALAVGDGESERSAA